MHQLTAKTSRGGPPWYETIQTVVSIRKMKIIGRGTLQKKRPWQSTKVVGCTHTRGRGIHPDRGMPLKCNAVHALKEICQAAKENMSMTYYHTQKAPDGPPAALYNAGSGPRKQKPQPSLCVSHGTYIP